MKIFCLSDPHLGFGVDKPMHVFGDIWRDHASKIEKAWRNSVGPSDLVIIPGDISWASNTTNLKPDMDFLGSLPGRILLGKGNHEMWWPKSHAKAASLMPPNTRLLDSTHPFIEGELAIVGTRMWDNPALSFVKWIQFNPGTSAKDLMDEEDEAARDKIFARELQRLDAALASLGNAKVRIAAIHYPPTTPDFIPTVVTEKLSAARVQHCVFGHIHSLKPGTVLSGPLDGVQYHLCAVDHINFTPRMILEI
ncbi:MAG: metallophosphoesterase [Planctomycetota bacterium]